VLLFKQVIHIPPITQQYNTMFTSTFITKISVDVILVKITNANISPTVFLGIRVGVNGGTNTAVYYIVVCLTY
jgi:hypothetical protein